MELRKPQPPASERPNPFFVPALPEHGRRWFLGVLGLLGFVAAGARAAEPAVPAKGGKEGKGGKRAGGGRGEGKGVFVVPAEHADHAELSLILGRVTATSATFSLLSRVASEAYLEIGASPGKYDRKTAVTPLPAGQPVEVEVEGLRPDSLVHYRLHRRKVGEPAFAPRSERRFSTQRAPGSRFTFTLQGDSHPERMGKVSNPELYARTLAHAAETGPDFHICMGDDFSVERVPTVNPESLAAPYILQRPFLGIVGQTAPLYLLNGNHEQASLYNYRQADERRAVAVGAQVARNRFYPTPKAGAFHSGDPTPWKDIGELRSYCAWTWGDALFVILDNYWHSPALVDGGFKGEKAGSGGKGRDRDWWGITLGDAQYAWFKRTLEQSKARHKFVFAHHILGTGRGGVEEADLYEWGGKGKGGTFAEKRPGWELPVHQLMAKHKVSIFFQGHDHLYCRQEKDGVVYQELPMPSDATYEALNADRYSGGPVLPNSGYVRVSVGPDEVRVEYVRTFLPKDESADRRHGAVAHSYVVKPR
jgi:hypothetical protein